MVSCWRFYDSGKRTLCSSTKTFVASALASRLPDGNLQRSLVHHGDVVIVFPPEVGELAVLAGIVALVFQCRATDTPVKGVADEPREFEGSSIVVEALRPDVGDAVTLALHTAEIGFIGHIHAQAVG